MGEKLVYDTDAATGVDDYCTSRTESQTLYGASTLKKGGLFDKKGGLFDKSDSMGFPNGGWEWSATRTTAGVME